MQEVPRYDHQQMRPRFPDQEHLKCPRCDSDNTKFCYYNNYNLSQPRHYCKSCRRYWTKGGTLRNIPVGGGSRKLTKRSTASSTKRYSSSSTQKTEQPGTYSALLPAPGIDVGGSYSSLLTSPTVAQFGSFLEGLNPAELQMGEVREDLNSITDASLGKPEVVELNQSRDHNESVNYLGVNGAGGEDDSLSCWDSGNGWPDLAINTPAQILSTRNKWEHVPRRSSIAGEKEVALEFTGFLGLDGGFRAVNIAEEEEDEGGFWLLAGFIRADHPMASVLSADSAVVSCGAVSSSHLPDLVLFVNPQCLLIAV